MWLIASSEPVLTVAFAMGFGELSTFNGRFRTLFGATRSACRAQEGGK